MKGSSMSLKHSLLAILSRKSKTGYELSKDVEGSTGFFWNATHQQIYKELSALQRKGWIKYKEVEQADKPDKKLYSTTKDGVDELKRWLQEPTEPGPSKDVFLIKLFVGDLVSPAIILEDLLRHKKTRQSRLRKYMEIEKLYFANADDMSIEKQFQYLTLRRGITFENAWLTWCKEVEEFLNLQITKAKPK